MSAAAFDNDGPFSVPFVCPFPVKRVRPDRANRRVSARPP